jgi:hypothetical protein
MKSAPLLTFGLTLALIAVAAVLITRGLVWSIGYLLHAF